MTSVSLSLLWIQLIVLAVAIVISATYLTKSADVIAFKTGLGRSFIGVVMLATATSLPELGTGLTSVISISGYEGINLAAGDVFGSNIFNLLIIGLLDILWRNGSIFRSVSKESIYMGFLGILLMAIPIIGILVHKNFNFLQIFPLSPITLILLVAFTLSLYFLYKKEKPDDDFSDSESYMQESLFKSFMIYFIAATAVVVAAIFLARIGDAIAIKMDVSHGIVGTQFLALCTSLPELAASVAAIRIMAPQLAISNLLGSNLFNMGFVLFLDDVAYSQLPIWELFSYIHLLTALVGIIMTGVVLVSVMKSNKNSFLLFGKLSIGSMILILLYVITSILVFVI